MISYLPHGSTQSISGDIDRCSFPCPSLWLRQPGIATGWDRSTGTYFDISTKNHRLVGRPNFNTLSTLSKNITKIHITIQRWCFINIIQFTDIFPSMSHVSGDPSVLAQRTFKGKITRTVMRNSTTRNSQRYSWPSGGKCWRLNDRRWCLKLPWLGI